jgi:hypothetical protein
MVRTLLLTLALGCDPAPAPPTADAPAPAPTPVTPTSPQGEPASPRAEPPAGSIGGGVILERPVVLGGIENDAVEAALDRDQARACNTAGRPGKVLLKFHIDAPGTVSQVTQKASTLRHPETEACLQALVQGTAFPPLSHGSTAIVTWPFSL